MRHEPNSVQVMDIVPGTSVDGPGLRTSIYFAGCLHHCEGCHNPQSWPMDAGRPMAIDEVLDAVEQNGFNVTFSGGDPIYQASSILPLAKAIKQFGYDIWCYTGFSFEELLVMPAARHMLNYIDVVVDGVYRQELRDISLRFKGSSNQRIIDVTQSLKENAVVLWDDAEATPPQF